MSYSIHKSKKHLEELGILYQTCQELGKKYSIATTSTTVHAWDTPYLVHSMAPHEGPFLFRDAEGGLIGKLDHHSHHSNKEVDNIFGLNFDLFDEEKYNFGKELVQELQEKYFINFYLVHQSLCNPDFPYAKLAQQHRLDAYDAFSELLFCSQNQFPTKKEEFLRIYFSQPPIAIYFCNQEFNLVSIARLGPRRPTQDDQAEIESVILQGFSGCSQEFAAAFFEEYNLFETKEKKFFRTLMMTKLEEKAGEFRNY